MTTECGSAKIYAFPARGRFATGAPVAAQRQDAHAPDQASSRYAKITCGSSWYHEEAILEADKSRTN